MPFFPRLALSPFLGGDYRGRIDRLPRIQRSVPFFDFRAFVFVEVDLHRRARISVTATDLSLLDFRLLMV